MDYVQGVWYEADNLVENMMIFVSHIFQKYLYAVKYMGFQLLINVFGQTFGCLIVILSHERLETCILSI